MTKIEVAKAMGLSTRAISFYEAGEREPGPDVIADFARVLRYPSEFFSGPDLEMPTHESASFRAFSNMTSSQRDASLASGALAMEIARWIESRFNLPKADIPDLRSFDPEAAAQALRERWGIGERPIKNMIHLLEAHGVRVFSLAEEYKAVNAFSHWRSDVPFVFLNTMKSAESGRFDAAHELGHLAMHKMCPPMGKPAEKEADRFASAFLMPQGDVRAHAPKFASAVHIIALKKRWNVSAMALVHRLHSLGLIRDWSYRMLCIELSKFGARTSEPDGGEREASQVLGKVFEALRAEGASKASIAKDVGILMDDLNTLVFGLVVGAAPGIGTGTADKARGSHLQLVP